MGCFSLDSIGDPRPNPALNAPKDWAYKIAVSLTPEGKPVPDSPEALESFRQVLADNLRTAKQQGIIEERHRWPAKDVP